MIDEKLLAQLLDTRSSAAQQKLSQIFRWLDQIDSRVNQLESRLSELANHPFPIPEPKSWPMR